MSSAPRYVVNALLTTPLTDAPIAMPTARWRVLLCIQTGALYAVPSKKGMVPPQSLQLQRDTHGQHVAHMQETESMARDRNSRACDSRV